MSKSKSTTNKPPRKKVVVTTQQKTDGTKKKKIKPTTSKKKTTASTVTKPPLTFGRDNYLWMGIGVLLIFIGLLLMSGGNMPSPEVWDDNIIYSFRRTVLAPLVILAGLAVEIYAIFKGYRI